MGSPLMIVGRSGDDRWLPLWSQEYSSWAMTAVASFMGVVSTVRLDRKVADCSTSEVPLIPEALAIVSDKNVYTLGSESNPYLSRRSGCK